ncbi:MAG: isopentenyl phosphate kinase [Halanaeroarchaeum sp.]
MTIVLKLGGSVITEKDHRETVDRDAVRQIAADVGAASTTDLVLVHGGGSFGHPAAAERGVSRTSGTTAAADVRAIHDAMGDLLRAVIEALGSAGVPAIPVRPLSLARRSASGELRLETGPIRAMREEGFVPVLHGDVVASAGKGATIVSGDELVVAVAEGLDAERVGLCSTVPGVLDDEGAVVPSITAYEDVEAILGESESTDVTGGMAAKVRALLDADRPASIFGPGEVAAFLDGETPGTRIG